MMADTQARHLQIGAVVFPRIDQGDLTGPFEILSRVPDSTFHLIWKEKTPIPDARGLILTPQMTFPEAPQLDLLVLPGGPGQEALMEDEVVLAFIQRQARGASCILSVCTGVLLCGAAGLLKGVRATTHWSAHHLLPYFGAIPVNARVVVDGKYITTAGVTAGLDGALRVVVFLRNDLIAQQIQLAIEYAPEPPFASGTPRTAPLDVVAAARSAAREITDARLATAQRIALRLGVQV